MGPGFTDLREFLEEELGYGSLLETSQDLLEKISAQKSEQSKEYEESGPRKLSKKRRGKTWRKTPPGKLRDRRYRRTESYKLSRQKYEASPKGKAARKRQYEKRREIKNEKAKEKNKAKRDLARGDKPKKGYKLTVADITLIRTSPLGAVQLAKQLGVTRDAIYYHRKKAAETIPSDP